MRTGVAALGTQPVQLENVELGDGVQETWRDWIQVAHKCWKEEPKERPTFEELHKELQGLLARHEKTLPAMRDIGKLSKSS